MRWPWRKVIVPRATRAEAFMSYLEFMEGIGPPSYRFPTGDYSPDEIASDVEAIILHETRDMATATHPDRVREFVRRRARSRARRAGTHDLVRTP